MASMIHGHRFDGASSLFSDPLFVQQEPAPVSGDPSNSPSKKSGIQGTLPLTVKQIAEGQLSGDDKSNLIVDGVHVVNVKLVGMVKNKTERVTNVSLILYDGTGPIEVNRWINEVSDGQEVSAIQEGMYVKVSGHIKGLPGKRHVVAFSVQPVIDFNSIVLHFIECIYVNLVNNKRKGAAFAHPQNMGMQSGNRLMGYQAPFTDQYTAHSGMNGSANGICNLVLKTFQDPAMIGHDHGLHVDEVVRKLGFPKNMIMDAITYHVNMGHIYCTVDENHFKSAYNV